MWFPRDERMMIVPPPVSGSLLALAWVSGRPGNKSGSLYSLKQGGGAS